MRTRRTIAVASGSTASALHISPNFNYFPIEHLYFTTTTFV
jgi:hypothetical protein